MRTFTVKPRQKPGTRSRSRRSRDIRRARRHSERQSQNNDMRSTVGEVLTSVTAAALTALVAKVGPTWFTASDKGDHVEVATCQHADIEADTAGSSDLHWAGVLREEMVAAFPLHDVHFQVSGTWVILCVFKALKTESSHTC